MKKFTVFFACLLSGTITICRSQASKNIFGQYGNTARCYSENLGVGEKEQFGDGRI